ncbi:septation protein SepH [Brachybacterium sp. YJGR34]|uniref:septation protein SepH n=1 Tax=Brachybacterium sp. YJGR34 TaxID=2059911 RepID=UPI000E0A4216|nr:septation protein SepH [Brachybacterium sp. YJGR34]
MRELELDGIHDDGEHVILADSDGARYTLRIDRALRAAVRADRPALNMIQATDAAPLRPREMQAMLRAGRTAEEIAEASEIPLEHVRRYEGPVLAEREWTAQRARTFPISRGGPALLAVVTERLAAREAGGETAWDAWRRQDGTWTLQLRFSAGGRPREAHWVADLDNRSVSPVDDEARWIHDEDPSPEVSRSRGRLQAVKSSVYDLEADGSLEGNTAAPRRSRPWPGPTPVSEDHPSAIDDGELDALNARRGLRSVPRPDDSATVWSSLDEDLADRAGDEDSATGSQGASGDPAATADADRQALREHSSEVPDLAPGEDGTEPDELEQSDPTAPSEAEDDESPEAADSPAAVQDTVDLTPLPGLTDSPSAETELEPEPETGSEETAEEDEKPARKRSRTKSRRASMPSWDEIVFGSKQD